MAEVRDMLEMLSGGDRRSLGQVEEVVKLVAHAPQRLPELIEYLWSEDAVIRMRSADALEKTSRPEATAFAHYKARLLRLMDESTQQEVRWHLALIVPRLELTPAECERVAERLEAYLDDGSSIVKTNAMQGLVDLVAQNRGLRPVVLDLLRTLSRTGTPAMRARERILLAKLGQE